MFIPRPAIAAVAVAALVLLARTGAAQTSSGVAHAVSPVAVPSVGHAPDAVVATDAHTPIGPTTQRSVAGIRVDASAPASHAPAPAVARVGRNPAMMIVGGAALIAGAVIGGDAGTIVMVGGALVGLVGLWNYLR